MTQKLKKKDKEFFFKTYKNIKKNYEKIFIDKKNLNIYWFGVASLPLIYFSTILVYLNECNKHHGEKLYSHYEEKISLKTFNKSAIKVYLLKLKYFFIKNLFFFKKKIFIIYSSSKLSDDFCKKKNFFQIKIDPFWYLSAKSIEKQNCNPEFLKRLDVFLRKIFDDNLKKNKKRLKIINIIKKKFIYYNKIYELFNKQSLIFKNNLYITSYTGIIFVRLFLSSLRLNNNAKVITVTHGEVEVLNQLPDLSSDASLLGDYLICKSKHFKKRCKYFFKNLNKNYIQPKYIFQKNLNELKKIKKNYTKKREMKKKILIVGYPHTNQYNINAPHIMPNNYRNVEMKILKNLLTLGYDVTYNLHPDRVKENLYFFSNNNFKISTSKFEEIEKDYHYSLFTYHRSTALGNAMKTNLAILLLSFKKLDFDEYTFNLLSKRISFIDMNLKRYSGSKKVNLIELEKKIKKSEELVNLNIVKNLLS